MINDTKVCSLDPNKVFCYSDNDRRLLLFFIALLLFSVKRKDM